MNTDPEPEPADIFAYVIVLIVLIILSAFFSASETAYTSLNRPRLKTRVQDGKKSAEHVLSLAENYDRVSENPCGQAGKTGPWKSRREA